MNMMKTTLPGRHGKGREKVRVTDELDDDDDELTFKYSPSVGRRRVQCERVFRERTIQIILSASGSCKCCCYRSKRFYDRQLSQDAGKPWRWFVVGDRFRIAFTLNIVIGNAGALTFGWLTVVARPAAGAVIFSFLLALKFLQIPQFDKCRCSARPRRSPSCRLGYTSKLDRATPKRARLGLQSWILLI